MRRLSLLCSLPLVFSAAIQSQIYSAEQVEVAPPALRVEAPPANATAAQLERRGDELRALKNYLDAIDYYAAALAKHPNNAVIENKMGMAYLGLQRLPMAKKCFNSSIRMDRNYSEAYNNLGAV